MRTILICGHKKNLDKVSLRSVLEYCYAIKSNNKKHTRFRLVGSVVRAKSKDYLQEKDKGANIWGISFFCFELKLQKNIYCIYSIISIRNKEKYYNLTE